MEKEMRTIGIRVPIEVHRKLSSFVKQKGYSLSGYCTKVIEMEAGYPESRRLELQEDHETISELCRRIIVTTTAERKLCLTYDEFDDFKMLQKVTKWQFQEPKGEGK